MQRGAYIHDCGEKAPINNSGLNWVSTNVCMGNNFNTALEGEQKALEFRVET